MVVKILNGGYNLSAAIMIFFEVFSSIKLRILVYKANAKERTKKYSIYFKSYDKINSQGKPLFTFSAILIFSIKTIP
jgi:hypothetical protein